MGLIIKVSEDEIRACELLQNLIVDQKLVLVEDQQRPSIVGDENLAESIMPSDVPSLSKEESINIIGGSEEDVKELQECLNQESRKVKEVVTQQPYVNENEGATPKTEPVGEPDPKGANCLDLFYKQPPRDIMVDEYQKRPSNLYPEEDQKKN